MSLVDITPPEFDLVIALAYATAGNITGRPFYRADARPYLHPRAAERLRTAIELARPLGCRLKIFDAYRPAAGQWALWRASPEPEFVAEPTSGGPHTRGVAIDLTLVHAQGRELEMGTAFDAMTPLSHQRPGRRVARGATQPAPAARPHDGGRLRVPRERMVALSACRRAGLSRGRSGRAAHPVMD